jgi:hypothetical protein
VCRDQTKYFLFWPCCVVGQTISSSAYRCLLFLLVYNFRKSWHSTIPHSVKISISVFSTRKTLPYAVNICSSYQTSVFHFLTKRVWPACRLKNCVPDSTIRPRKVSFNIMSHLRTASNNCHHFIQF